MVEVGPKIKNMMKSEKLQIEDLSKKRYEFIEAYNNSWVEKSGRYSMIEPKEIDEIGDEIMNLIKQWKNLLPFEFIIEEITKLGDAPNILYDDNGNFAIEGTGMQTVTTDEPIDVEMFFFVKAEKWKPTLREALNYYLSEND